MCIELLVRISCSREDYTGGVFLNNAVYAKSFCHRFACLRQLIFNKINFIFRIHRPNDGQPAGSPHAPIYVIRRGGEALLWRGSERHPGPGPTAGYRSGERPTLSVSLSVCLSVCLLVCLSVCPSSCLSRPARTDNFVMQPKLF